jgi:ketosteroid isomerase-like protein
LDARNVDALVAMFAEDIVRVDHRKIGWEDIQGRGAVREHYHSLLDMWPTLRVAPQEVIACDDQVIALTETTHGTSAETGSTAELSFGVVARIENGLITHWDQYDPGDRWAMIARYAELGGGHGPLGDRPPERLVRRVILCYAEQDVGAFFDMFTDDFVMIDHKKLGGFETDKRGQRGLFESIVSASLDVRFEVREVLACDDHVIALTYAFCGHAADGGGAFEIPSGIVCVVADGMWRRLERFESDDRAGMLARYAELGGHREVLGDRPPERFLAEFQRLVAARDVDGMMQLYATGYVRIDHRKFGWELGSRATERAELESIFATASDLSCEVDEVLACDDRVIASVLTFRGHGADSGGTFEMAFGDMEVMENGLCVRTEFFDPGERQAMIARFAELGGGLAALGDRPPERWLAEFAGRYARRDIDRLMELYTDDFVTVDHRTLGWEEMRKDDGGQRAALESSLAAGSDQWFVVDEVLACDDRFIAARGRFHGKSADGGGAFEIAFGVVAVVEDGQVSWMEWFDYDAREAVLVRYAELDGHPRGAR